MRVSPAEAAEYLLRIRKAQTSFPEFVKAINPNFVWADFQLELMDALDQLERRTLTNDNGDPVYSLLITMPPRHAKSFLATIMFPVYYLAKRPNRNVLSTSYNQDLAKTFGRQVRDLAREPLVSQSFPDFGMSDESRAVDDWRTTANGTYFATGLAGSTTGRAATLLLLDDPIKAREEADSAITRNKTWSYYLSALSTRKQPEPDGAPPIEIVILTRWHPDDVAGRIMETEDWREGRWKHINFPAIRETLGEKRSVLELPPDDPRHIPPGKLSTVAPGKRFYRVTEEAALWPERFPLEDLKRRQRLDPREFAALYQQSPYIRGGNLIKAAWWRTYDRSKSTSFNTVIIVADTAFKKTEQADFSVLMVLAMDALGDIFIIDVIREKLDFPELKRRCISLNTLWRGKGLRGLYIEDKASGQSLVQELKSASGLAVLPYKVSNDKVTRVNAVTPLIEGGRVFVPESAPWLDAFMDECQSFPSGKHDDQVDALSMGLDIMSRINVRSADFLAEPINVNNSLYAQFSPINPGQRNGPWIDDIGKKQTRDWKAWGEL